MVDGTMDSVRWYAIRPAFWPHLLRRLAARICFRSEGDDSRARAHCEAVAVPMERVIAAVCGEVATVPIRKLYPAEFQFAEAAAARCPVKMGGPGALDLLYSTARHIRASRVLETGVAYGWSSLALLLALKDIDGALLVSTDMPYVRLDNEPWVGCVVPRSLTTRWDLIRLPDDQALPGAIERLRPLDLCHYDSDKTYQGRMWAYPRLWEGLRPGGVFISDDVGDNMAFFDFATSINVPPIVGALDKVGGMQYVGVIVKP